MPLYSFKNKKTRKVWKRKPQGEIMKVGDLVKRRNNGDLALVVKVLGCTDGEMQIMRLECGNIQSVWDFEYEVIA